MTYSREAVFPASSTDAGHRPSTLYRWVTVPTGSWFTRTSGCTLCRIYKLFAMARDTVDRFDAWDKIPESVKKVLKEADPTKESVKGEEFEKWGNRIFGVMPEDVPGSFLRTAMRRAGELGFKPVLLSKFISPVETVPAGLYAACIAQQIERSGEPFEPPVALFSGGELITTVGNEIGIGGRNQEFCLSAARLLNGSKNIIFGSLDTDGTDGPGTQYTKGMEGIRPVSGVLL